MEIRADRPSQIETTCQGRNAIGIARPHAGEADLETGAAGRLEIAEQLSQPAIGHLVAMRMSQYRRAAGIGDALHRARELRPTRRHVSRLAAFEPTVESRLHAGQEPAR